MPLRTELSLRLPNTPGALAEVWRLLSEERVAIVVMSLERSGELRLLVDNPVRARGVLTAARHRVTERSVVVLSGPETSGAATAGLGLMAAAGVNIEYAYAGTVAAGTVVVLGVDDPVRTAARVGV